MNAKGGLKERTKQFSLRVIRLYASLPKDPVAQTIGWQLLRSGTSPGAHYREAFRARSTAEFISKIEGGLQELEETDYWFELLHSCDIGKSEEIVSLRNETDELIAIFTASAITAKKRKHESDKPKRRKQNGNAQE